MLTVDETLVNALRNLIKEEKVIKIEKEKSTMKKIIEQINQIQKNLRLIETIENQLKLINQIYQSFFVSLTFKATTNDDIFIISTKKSLYNNNMTEDFQKLKKFIEKKISNLINRQTTNQIKRQNQTSRNNVSILKNLTTSRNSSTKTLIQNETSAALSQSIELAF